MSVRVAVVGAGITGLAIAYRLQRLAGESGLPLRLHVFEASSQTGGKVRTLRENGWIAEWGPTGFLTSLPSTYALAQELGLENEIVRAAPAAANRYVLRRDSLQPVPTRAGGWLRSPLLPAGSKLRLLAEPWVPGRVAFEDESIRSFAARRIGPEAARVLVGALITGIYAGDDTALSLRACLPRMWQLEARWGSLTRALLSRERKTGSGPGGPEARGLHSFRRGMQTLTDALSERLRSSLFTGVEIDRVSSRGRRGLRIHPVTGAPMDVDAVAVCVPPHRASRLLGRLDPVFEHRLGAIPSVPLAVIHLGYRSTAVPEGLVGFGFLVPPGERASILGCLYISCVFAGRTPEGHALFTVMAGGSRAPEIAGLDDDALVAQVSGELARLAQIRESPVFRRVLRHPQAIPQYPVGHLDGLAEIESARRRVPGLFLAGNALRGVSVNHCVADAQRVARRMFAYLTRGPGRSRPEPPGEAGVDG